MVRRSRSHLVCLLLFIGARGVTHAQSFSCNVQAPAKLMPDEAATITFTATNTGMTPLVATNSDDAIRLSLTPYSADATILRHVRVVSPSSDDPRLGCSIRTDGAAVCVSSKAF